jgi:hypothetical protein
MLLLEQVDQVGGRTNPLQSLDRIEYHVDSALGRHGSYLDGFRTSPGPAP